MKKLTNEMTPEELRLELAELLGWTNVQEENDILIGRNPVDAEFEDLPDWPSDLNACHEAEKALGDEDRIVYLRLLNSGDFSYRRLAFATALQRTKALVETLREKENNT